jgi:hypothetical protein
MVPIPEEIERTGRRSREPLGLRLEAAFESLPVLVIGRMERRLEN